MNSKKINFVIVGCQRGATTSLFYTLQQHPNIQMSIVKEPVKILYDIDNYESYFKPYKNGLIRGLSLPQIMQFPNLIDVLLKHNPNIKIISIIREPFSRVASALKMYYQIGLISKNQFLEYEPELPVNINLFKNNVQIHEIDHNVLNNHRVVSETYYNEILEFIDKKVRSPESNLMIIDYKDIDIKLGKILNFLNLSIKFNFKLKKINSSAGDQYSTFLFFILKNIKIGSIVYYLLKFLGIENRSIITNFLLFYPKRTAPLKKLFFNNDLKIKLSSEYKKALTINNYDKKN